MVTRLARSEENPFARLITFFLSSFVVVWGWGLGFGIGNALMHQRLVAEQGLFWWGVFVLSGSAATRAAFRSSYARLVGTAGIFFFGLCIAFHAAGLLEYLAAASPYVVNGTMWLPLASSLDPEDMQRRYVYFFTVLYIGTVPAVIVACAFVDAIVAFAKWVGDFWYIKPLSHTSMIFLRFAVVALSAAGPAYLLYALNE